MVTLQSTFHYEVVLNTSANYTVLVSDVIIMSYYDIIVTSLL